MKGGWWEGTFFRKRKKEKKEEEEVNEYLLLLLLPPRFVSCLLCICDNISLLSLNYCLKIWLIIFYRVHHPLLAPSLVRWTGVCCTDHWLARTHTCGMI
jgi:hypothetical protein